MNYVFFVIFVICGGTMLFACPDKFLTALLSGAQKAVTLCVTLAVVYSVWLGFIKLMEKSGVTGALARLMYKPNKLLFGIDDAQSLEYISSNLSANMLGLGGAATPFGIKAVESLDDKRGGVYAKNMLFVINATSIQLIPTTVIALREKLGSANAYDILLPSLIVTALSTALSIAAVAVFMRKSRGK